MDNFGCCEYFFDLKDWVESRDCNLATKKIVLCKTMT